MAYSDYFPVFKSVAQTGRRPAAHDAKVALTAFSRLARRAVITAGLEAAGIAARLAPGMPDGGLGLIFTLHHVRPAYRRSFEPNAHLSITPEFLDAALGEMKALGYQPVRLEDVPARLARGGSRRFFAMTLDDGNRNNAEHAAPVFRAHGVPYTVFATQGLSERTATMWWETVAALVRAADLIEFDFGGGVERLPARTVEQKNHVFNRMCIFVESVFEDEAIGRINEAARRAGIEPNDITAREIMTPDEIAELSRDPLCSIGAHTVTHCDLARATPERLSREVRQSVDAVERWTGKRPTTFAYPYGFARVFGEREQNAVRDAGLSLAVTTRPGVLTPEHAGRLMALPRVSLNGFYQKQRYVRALASGLAFRFMR